MFISKDLIKKCNEMKKLTGKNSISIMNCFLFKNGKLTVMTSEKMVIQTNVDIKEDFCINAHIFVDFLKTVKPNSEIEFFKFNDANIKFGGSILKTIPIEKFPEIEVNQITPVNLENSTISTIPELKKVITCVSLSEVRRFVSGILFDFKLDKMILVSTDGKRMSVLTRNEKHQNEGQYIVPFQVVDFITKIKAVSAPSFDFSEKKGYCKIDDYEIRFNLLEGNFPPYEKVIPKESMVTVTFNEDFTMALKAVKPFIDKFSKKVIIDFERSVLINENLGIGNSEIPFTFDFSGDIMERIAVNHLFVEDVFKVMEKPEFQMKTYNDAIAIYEKSGKYDHTYVMMPMLLN